MEPTAFRQGSRFELLRTLGHGATGVVHEAFDHQRSARIALKVLYRVSSEGILRLKNEFRALQGIEHPNLMTPIELLQDEGRWVIVMELVHGVGLLSYVRPHDVGLDERDPESTLTLGDMGNREPEPPPLPRNVRDEPQFDEARLRSALGQLVAGLTALHGAKKVHRDIKPSNVMVGPDGRLVILDFGLIAETDSSFSQEHMLGTAGYVAPEQIESGPPSPAMDWYSVGVVLYEALTGRRPWEGSVVHVLTQKRTSSPVPPSAFARVPEDLESLCLALLRRDPAARPGAEEIRQRLGQGAIATTGDRVAAPAFVGRESELLVLRRAFDEMARGRAATVLVSGESGVGKSALVERFLAQLRRGPRRVVVLRGRCYESESVPYKALDGVVDSLSHLLRSLPEPEVAGLVPVRAGLLTQAFPVLGRVQAMARAPSATSQTLDLQERRTRMSAALRDLLVRLCERYPVVIAIDDMQWADVDSLRLYRDVMQPPDSPPVLLIGTMRGRGPMLPEAAEGKPLPGEIHTVHLLGLSPAEAHTLASHLLARDDPASAASAEAIATEAAGHPLFIGELVRFSRSLGTPAAAAISLDEAVRARVEQLSSPCRVLVEVIAVAGRPIAQEHARLASGIEPEEMGRAVAALRAGSLIEHARAHGLGVELDVYHDRVREAVLASLDPIQRRRHHRALATTMASVAEPDALAIHWLGAGERGEAGRCARQAADQAMGTLAFGQAARLYRMALELSPVAGAEATALRTRLGDALTNAGRSAEAAQAYLDATAGAPEAVAIELRSRAAGQLLRSGRFEQGMSTLREVLAAAQLHLPHTGKGALVSFALRRAQLRLRGYRFRERDVSEIGARDLLVADTCWSAALALSVVDTVRGQDFQARHLLLALRAGEPRRILCGLALEGAYLAARGVKAAARTARLLARAQALAEKTQDPYSIGFCRLGFGVAAYLQGQWPKALRLCTEAEQIFQEHCTGVAWECARARAYGLWSMSYLGELARMNARVPHLLKAAQERGDICDATNLGAAHTNIGWLALDQPELARDEVTRAMRPWPVRGLQVQHYYQLLSLTQIDLYLGRGRTAFERVGRELPRLVDSWLSRIEGIRIGMKFLRARAALAAMVDEQTDPIVQLTEAAARSIASEHAPWSGGLASMVQAQVACLMGDGDRAARRLERAIDQLGAASMGLHAAVARRRLGELMGGEEGRAFVARADAWMREHGVSRPEPMALVLAPGRSVA
jgi:tRNA A-37 threonylcarbamoyl transferase component Bud32/tetratricopeptide (TPR) repeat protein